MSGQPPASSHYRAWLYEQPQERREELLALEGAYVRERARARRQDRLEAAFEESLQGRQDTPAGGLIIVKRVPWL